MSTSIRIKSPGRTLMRPLAAGAAALLVAGLLSVGGAASPAAAYTQIYADFPGAIATQINAANGMTGPVTLTLRDPQNLSPWTLPGNLPEITKDLTIVGPGSGDLVIDMNQKQGFVMSGTASSAIKVSISGLALKNPLSSAVDAWNTNLSVSDLTVLSAPQDGLEVRNYLPSKVEIIDSYFAGANNGVKVILSHTGSTKATAELRNVTAANNTWGLSLSANGDSKITVADARALANSARGIDATVLGWSSIDIRDSLIEANPGGGVRIRGDATPGAFSGFVDFTRSVVRSNGALSTDSGGILVVGEPEALHVSLDGSSVYRNKSDNGAAINMKAGPHSSLDLRHSTISENTVSGLFAGIFVAGASASNKMQMDIYHSTIAHNGDSQHQPGVWGQWITGLIQHTIVSDSVGGANDLVLASSSMSVDYSLVQKHSGSATTAVNASATNISGQSAALGPLQNNGGRATMLTHLPKVSSPALEAGDPGVNAVTYDQRGVGFPRVIGVIDIGSVESPVVVDRIGGGSRYVTAVNISKAGFPAANPNVPVVFVATGSDYPDALSAAAAAVKLGGPLLLTESTSLPGVVKAEIQRLNPQKIVVAGGVGAVSAGVFNSLKALQSDTVRVGGGNRFETSRMLTSFAFKAVDTSTAYIATGMNYPDALSASAAAAAAGSPVILVNGTAGALDAPTKATLLSLGLTGTFTAGGVGAVSAGIHSGLATYGTTMRFAGSNRFETSRLIGEHAFPAATHVFLATGTQFPDALAGAALAGAKGGPLYTSMPTCIPTKTALAVKAPTVSHVTLFGGPGALSANVFALNACS